MTFRSAASERRPGHPRLLLLGLAAGVATALLLLGIVTPSSLLSIALFGGMIGMHLFGHGMHGMHGGPGADYHSAADEPGQTPEAPGASSPSTRSRHGCH